MDMARKQELQQQLSKFNIQRRGQEGQQEYIQCPSCKCWVKLHPPKVVTTTRLQQIR
jgi:hypothetical protein